MEHILIFHEGEPLQDGRLPLVGSLRWESPRYPITMSYNFEDMPIGYATNVRREGSDIYADLEFFSFQYDPNMFKTSIFATHVVGVKDQESDTIKIEDMILRAVTLIPIAANPIQT